jgi:hypothetical protein
MLLLGVDVMFVAEAALDVLGPFIRLDSFASHQLSRFESIESGRI